MYSIAIGIVLCHLAPATALAVPGAGRYLGNPVEWFRSDEAGLITDHILAHQTPLGGWPKNIDTTTSPANVQLDPRAVEATFDNRATTDELRFLARRWNSTSDERCRTAFIRGLDYILTAQYPTGGWPQHYPPGKNYKRYITFNDGAMVRLMEFLREVASDEAYQFVPVDKRATARTAFDRGVQCILKCQVVVNGKRTVWCAQHDEVDYQPRPARDFELASLSGGESVGIVRLLMSLEKPDPDVRRSIEAAVAWFEEVKFKGQRLVDRNESSNPDERDRALVADPDAPPMWARFYEIGSNRPLFANRDGQPKYRFDEVDDPLRSHYAWLGYWPQHLLDRENPVWQRSHSTDHAGKNSQAIR